MYTDETTAALLPLSLTQRCNMSTAPYTAVIRQDGEWWIGWIEEIPGVNSQGPTRDALLENLKSALSEAIEMNRDDAKRAAGEPYEEVAISP